ncbi:hypothetical protein [Flavobacterium sp. XS1P27]|uniref:hypothetical protein n=1 Tax=Flavobacterium sp. XS1P27 TaxID=3401724 RepID=UPI003AAAA509
MCIKILFNFKKEVKLVLGFALFIFLISSCLNNNGSCDENSSPIRDYEGYGFIRFNKSSTGSIRYMEFYSICRKDIEKDKIIDVSKLNLKNGLIIRATNSSMLWQSLTENQDLSLNQENYGLALIFLKYEENKKTGPNIINFDNFVFVKNKGFKVRMFYPDFKRIEIRAFKILSDAN